MLTAILSVVVGGILGTAIDNSDHGRLAHFVEDAQSKPIQMFSPANATTKKGNWANEHAGKWLYAAALALERTGDKTLEARIVNVADYLVSLQEENGYIGNLVPEVRYYTRPKPDAMNVGWDTWASAYLMKGLCEASKATGRTAYLDAAAKMADLMCDTFLTHGLSIAQTGMHAGMAGIGTLDALCDLYRLRPEPRYKQLIYRCVEEMDSTPGLGLVRKAELGLDVALIGNAKIYEMHRCLTGLAKAYRLFGEERWLKACRNAWQNIHDHHLTPLGGPWGGINVNHEMFNRDCEFSPLQVTETCSVMEWMQFNYELLCITQDAKFANEIEKAAYNSLLAACGADGERWIYYLHTNGDYGTGNEWSCCWSSGMIALEDIPGYIYSVRKETLFVNMLTPSEAVLPLGSGRRVSLTQSGTYPFGGTSELTVGTDATFTLAVAKPGWTETCSLKLNGAPVTAGLKNGYITLKRHWRSGDRLTLEFPYEMQEIQAVQEYVTDSHRFPVWYTGEAKRYVCYRKGPLVYASEREGDKDGLKPVCQLPPYSGSTYRCLWFEAR